MKVCLLPQASTFTNTIGGVNRVVSDLTQQLPKYGVDVVDNPDDADIRHCHALSWHPQVDIYTNHGVWDNPVQDYEIAANDIIYRLLVAARVVTSVAEHTTRIYKNRLNVNPRVIRNGVDIEKLQSMPQDTSGKPVFLWAKNNMSGPNDPTPALWLARQMPDAQFIFTMAPSGRIPANVKVIGLQEYEDMLQIIANSSVLIATTKEQFSVQVVEALAMGKPILGFNWGGTPEVVHNGYNGYLAPAPRVYDQEWPLLHAAAERILQQYSNLSAGARESSLGYDWGRIIPQYIQCYEDALPKHDVEVSIVITCHNLEQYIEEAVLSALNQNFDLPYEIIVVDDLSQDNSRKILRSLQRKHKELQIILNSTNMRAGPSRNEGIKQARGEYIVCLDGDDTIPPDFIGSLHNIISSDRSIGIAYGGFNLFGEQRGTVRCQEWNFDKLKRGNLLGCCNMFRRVAWERCGGYKNINPSWEDYELWLNIGAHGYDGAYVPGTYFNYRIRNTGRNVESQGQEARLRAIVNACHPNLYLCQVGVVIPCYKQKEYLPDAIKSLQDQSLQDFRVVIVDDGGHQNLREVIPNDDHRFSLIELENNVGLPAARNRGIEHLHTEYIIPLDADDMLLPKALREMLKVQNSTIDPLLVYGDIVPFWDNGSETSVTLDAYNFDALLARNIVPATAMYPRESWQRMGGYDESMRNGYEDWDFNIRLGLTGVCGHKISTPVLKYRQHDGTMRDILEKDTGKRQSVLDYLRKKHHNIYEGVRPVGCCDQEHIGIHGKEVRRSATILRYTKNKIAQQVIFVGSNMYTFSASKREFPVVEKDIPELMKLGWFEHA